MAGIRIDELDQTVLQSRDHVIPAMKDGVTVQLSVAQVLSRLLRGDLAGKLFAADVTFDPGTGGPLVADNMQAAIEEILSYINEWRAKPCFEPFPLLIDPDIDVALMPPKLRGVDDAIYVLLSANKAGAGQYNEGILINQSVSGSGALVQATAVINLPGSPRHGATIHLMNTERRFLRAGEIGGGPEQDALENLYGRMQFRPAGSGNMSETFPSGGGGVFEYDGPIGDTWSARATTESNSSSTKNSVITFDASLTARTADETRVKNQSAVYFMRVQ